ncbi:uncharacterized protein LOC130639572 [Hydractinia symbiolongicarpus]|uniref:uncharacterized protein LOC130639572 n=1 Tax=Hydractinia symbiolongicarpus TaxID=13093 RepID=UPI00254B3DEC|nr:uncharacterized protein LOC130639572 [Hydractinia symbiolongicarpus]
MSKSYNYGYQPLDEFSTRDKDDTGVHHKLRESYELDDVGEHEKPSSESSGSSHVHGISVLTAGIFIIGEICGAGAVAFPGAMSKTGLYGLLIIAAVLVMSVYCGLLLGKSWKKIREQKESSDPIRDPYPYIGEIASGKKLRNGITFCLNTQLFLTCAIYLLLASEIVGSFIAFHAGQLHSEANLRLWLVVITLVILPLTWLGTPKDFWFIALAAAGSTTIALVLIWVKYGIIAPDDLGDVKKADITFGTLASAFGTFVFGFTGASLFPTIQSDMKSPNEFAKAAYLGYFGISLLYIPTAIGGYLTIGAKLEDSILTTLSNYDKDHGTNRVLVSVAECLFATHFLSGFVLMINPLLQQLEAHFDVPYEFSPKRVGLRSAVVLCILASCEAFPKFGPIVDLVGGSINVFLCFIFPIWCYLRLYPETSNKERLVMFVVGLVATLAGVASTVSNCINIKEAFHKLYFAPNATKHY